jgi:hypothetical protein
VGRITRIHTATLSESYSLRLEEDLGGQFITYIDGPLPHRHTQALLGLDDAKRVAYVLAVWHFTEQHIGEMLPLPNAMEWRTLER